MPRRVYTLEELVRLETQKVDTVLYIDDRGRVRESFATFSLEHECCFFAIPMSAEVIGFCLK